ncbi:hypothetical protein HZH66_007224 [Vespula vulgaris]|uniref:Uncharacterized protein n=1 Tax=Vespula vulgaris TaxID=7454 RepID=A0A834N4W2_VESVU|nr:hypothetical protein HZH66_007224 [Vespula vulgaris]
MITIIEYLALLCKSLSYKLHSNLMSLIKTLTSSSIRYLHILQRYVVTGRPDESINIRARFPRPRRLAWNKQTLDNEPPGRIEEAHQEQFHANHPTARGEEEQWGRRTQHGPSVATERPEAGKGSHWP